MASILKLDIHRALVAMLQAGPYFAVAFPAGDSIPSVVDPDTAPQITPASAGADEVNAGFGVDGRHGRREILHRTDWRWHGLVKFHGAVTAFQAEEDWLATPLIVPRSGGNPQAKILLLDAAYSHPRRQQSGGSGTQIDFHFEVRLGRR